MENQKSFLVCKIIVFCLAVGFLAGFGGCGSDKSKNVVAGALVGGVLGGGIGALASTSSATTAGYVATSAVVGAGAGAFLGAAATDKNVADDAGTKKIDANLHKNNTRKNCAGNKCADKNGVDTKKIQNAAAAA